MGPAFRVELVTLRCAAQQVTASGDHEASARKSLARKRKSRTGVAATKLMLVPDALRGQANSGPGDPCRPAPISTGHAQAAPSVEMENRLVVAAMIAFGIVIPIGIGITLLWLVP
jgi:hypothetical protein